MLPTADAARWHATGHAAAAVRTADSTSKGRTVGHVVVFLARDGSLVSALARRADLGDRRRLGLARDGSLLGAGRTQQIQSGAIGPGANDIRVAGVGYRAVAEDLGRAPRRVKLVA